MGRGRILSLYDDGRGWESTRDQESEALSDEVSVSIDLYEGTANAIRITHVRCACVILRSQWCIFVINVTGVGALVYCDMFLI